jgi:hypothetical protein
MRRYLLFTLPVLASFALSVGSAQAVVVDMGAAVSGRASVPFNTAARDQYFGVALIPGTRTPPNQMGPEEAGAGAALGAHGALVAAGIPTVLSSAACTDPALAPSLVLAPTGLCYHGGPILRRNETFALTWDAKRSYWSGTRSYVEQFLRDVADGSETLRSPFALTTQYTDAAGRAENQSRYGGGCIDYGNPDHVSNRNTTCLFGNSVQTGPGYEYPANGCTPTGGSYTDTGTTGFSQNDSCLTDAQLRTELTTIVRQMGIVGRTQPGYEPLVVLPLPPGVEACLAATSNLDGRLCSINGTVTPPEPTVNVKSDKNSTVPPGTYRFEITYQTGIESPPGESLAVTVDKPSDITISPPPQVPGATAWNLYATEPGETKYYLQSSQQFPSSGDISFSGTTVSDQAPPAPAYFCSYHSQLSIDGTDVAYVVQPWTAMTECDEPGAPAIPPNPPPDVLSKAVGARLVSPLSQAEIAAISDPQLDGWFALDGSEINDNGEINHPENNPLATYNQPGCIPGVGDGVTVGKSSQNPYLLQREWNNAAAIESDPITYFGCAPNVILTPSFVVPSPIDAGEVVGFDGSTTASTLIVPNANYTWSFGDGSTASGPSVVHSFAHAGSYTVTMNVTDRGGNTSTLTQTVEVLQADGQPPSPSGSGGGGPTKLKVSLALVPQSLRSVLRDGLAVRVRSNRAANGFATLAIFRSAAHRVHLSAAGNPKALVVIGRGTVEGIKNGTARLRVRVSSATARKLSRTSHLTLTLHMTLYAKHGGSTTAATVGRY